MLPSGQKIKLLFNTGLTLLQVPVVSPPPVAQGCFLSIYPALPGTAEEPGNSNMCLLSPEAHSYSGETGLSSSAEAMETVMSLAVWKVKASPDQRSNGPAGEGIRSNRV